jgi:hypothetical protein
MAQPRYRFEEAGGATISVTKQKIAAIDAAKLFGLIRPSDSTAIAAHRSTLFQGNDVNILRQVSEWRHEQRILGTIEFAKEAGLAVALSGDHRNSVGLVEYVGRADVHANIAGRTTLGVDDFDHSAASA